MGICLRYTKNTTDAEDLLQDTFIKVFKTLKQYKGDGDLGAWIRRIAVNTAIEKWRKKEKERMLELYRRETSGQNGYELKAYTEPHMSW